MRRAHTLVRRQHCSLSSRRLIGAKYCCLNSGFVSSVDKLSRCPFSLACSKRSITSTARFQTFFGKAAWENMASRCVLDISCWYVYKIRWQWCVKDCMLPQEWWLFYMILSKLQMAVECLKPYFCPPSCKVELGRPLPIWEMYYTQHSDAYTGQTPFIYLGIAKHMW